MVEALFANLQNNTKEGASASSFALLVGVRNYKERFGKITIPIERRWLMANWQAIKTEYITTDTSYRKLAQKYGVNATNIAKRASKEKWVDERKKNASKTLSKTLTAIGNKQADRAAKLFGVSDLLLDKVKSLLEANEELLVDTSIMKDVSVILKNLKDIQMIRSDADLREQEARIEKLRADAMANRNDDDDDETGVVLLPPVLEVKTDDR